jgi:type IV pilus assembly protein PilY1
LPNSGGNYTYLDTATKFLTPFYAAQFNNLAYDPTIRYRPGVNSLGVSLGNSTPTAARTEPYLAGDLTTKNLTTTWLEVVWCDTSTRTVAELLDPLKCKRNGIHTSPNPFVYKATSVAADADFSGGFPNTKFRFPIVLQTNPHFFTITAREHCTDLTLARCTLSATPVTISGTAFLVPAPARYCNSAANAAITTAVSDTPPTTPRCQAKWIGSYDYPRLGNITRTDIVSGFTYGNRPNRSDCAAAPNCTYTEELQNFANWFTYYRTRVLLMKTVAGHAFTALDDRYRVGFVAINPNDSNYYLKIDKFTPAHKAAWYDKFYKCPHQSGTPLKQALARVGRHFAGKQDGINSVLIDDPIQYSCQQNFAILTSDGYYGSEPGVQLDGTTDIGNQDNVPDTTTPFFVTRNPARSTATLGLVKCTRRRGDVLLQDRPAHDGPGVEEQRAHHDQGHRAAPAYDHVHPRARARRPDDLPAGLRNRHDRRLQEDQERGPAPNCSWTTAKCDWPVPTSGDPAKLDDLWHSAVNGRGTYFSAKNPDTLQAALVGALSEIKLTTGAAASASVSTQHHPVRQLHLQLDSPHGEMGREVVAERIDTATGSVIPGVVWSARDQLDTRVAISSDTRTIHTLDPWRLPSSSHPVRQPHRRGETPLRQQMRRVGAMPVAERRATRGGQQRVQRGELAARPVQEGGWGDLPRPRARAGRRRKRRARLRRQTRPELRRRGDPRLRLVQDGEREPPAGTLHRRQRRHAARLQRRHRKRNVGLGAADAVAGAVQACEHHLR